MTYRRKPKIHAKHLRLIQTAGKAGASPRSARELSEKERLFNSMQELADMLGVHLPGTPKPNGLFRRDLRQARVVDLATWRSARP